ncbi:hypothetical protein [Pacificispira sp.]|uniref:hypothetical protein n=1 Tax=Pacificispira sp. TaxID=2888761 RepID=UPI003B52260D
MSAGTNAREVTAQDMQALSQVSREEAARECFGLERVMTLIERCARAGFYQVLISPKRALCLQGTDVASDTTAKLSALGYTVTWELAYHRGTDRLNPSGAQVLAASMLVSWAVKSAYKG